MFLFREVFDIYLLAALIPPIALLIYVYKMDKIEKEPPGLIAKLFLYGALSVIGAIVLEQIGEGIVMPLLFSDNESTFNARLFLYFIVVACSEEGVKLFMLKKGSWDDPNFDYRFDAIVYAVAVGLGFAAAENIEYVFAYGLQTAAVRAITAIPGHAIFAVYMGYYYGMTKYHSRRYNRGLTKFYAVLTYVLPVILHGLYDFWATSTDRSGATLFYVYIIVLDVIAFISVRHFSKKDQMI